MIDADGFEAGFVDWSPDGKYLAVTSPQQFSGTPKKEIYILDSFTGKILSNIPVRTGNLVRWSPDNRYIVCSASLEIIDITRFDENGFKISGSFELKADSDPRTSPGGNDVCWSPDGRYIACSRVETIKKMWRRDEYLQVVEIWSINTRQIVLEIPYPYLFDNPRFYGRISVISWSPNGNYIAIGDLKGGTFIANVSTKQIVLIVPPAMLNEKVFLGGDLRLQEVHTLSWSPDSSKLIRGATGGSITPDNQWFELGGAGVQIWDISIGKPFADLVRDFDYESGSGSAVWSPDGKKVAFTTFLEICIEDEPCPPSEKPWLKRP